MRDGGAKNWITIGGMSLQPSEIAKICYIFAGAATLDRLFRKKNLGLFMALTLICLGCLALMNDFGAAAIFFVTFIVIAFLRSGDWTTLALICGGCGAGVTGSALGQAPRHCGALQAGVTSGRTFTALDFSKPTP